MNESKEFLGQAEVTVRLRPVFTVADEDLIRFVIYAGPNDDTGAPEFDEFSVDRKEAALIVRNHRRLGSFIERRAVEPGSYTDQCFGRFYIEPKDDFVNGITQ